MISLLPIIIFLYISSLFFPLSISISIPIARAISPDRDYREFSGLVWRSYWSIPSVKHSLLGLLHNVHRVAHSCQVQYDKSTRKRRCMRWISVQHSVDIILGKLDGFDIVCVQINFMLHMRGTLLFFKVIRQISSPHGAKIANFDPIWAFTDFNYSSN